MDNYILENDKLRAVIRPKSAELISLIKKDSNCEYLWNGDPKYWGWTSPLLFPIVGALRGNQYCYKGKTYTMKKHGFAKEKEFQLMNRTGSELWLKMEDDEKTYAVYPFHFRLEAGYRLNETGLEVMWRIYNKEEDTMYFSIGGHPAIRCPLQTMEDSKCSCYLGIESPDAQVQYIMVDPETSRIGKTLHEFSQRDNMHAITRGMFDYDALIFEDYQIKTAFLAGKDKKPYIKMHTTAPVTAFWSPCDEAPFICFEPWYGRGDGVDFDGNLEERAWEQRIEGKGVFEAFYELQVIM